MIGRLAFDGLNDTTTVVAAAETLEEENNDVLVSKLWNILTIPRGKSIILRVADVNDAETAREDGEIELTKPITWH